MTKTRYLFRFMLVKNQINDLLESCINVDWNMSPLICFQLFEFPCLFLSRWEQRQLPARRQLHHLWPQRPAPPAGEAAERADRRAAWSQETPLPGSESENSSAERSASSSVFDDQCLPADNVVSPPVRDTGLCSPSSHLRLYRKEDESRTADLGEKEDQVVTTNMQIMGLFFS